MARCPPEGQAAHCPVELGTVLSWGPLAGPSQQPHRAPCRFSQVAVSGQHCPWAGLSGPILCVACPSRVSMASAESSSLVFLPHMESEGLPHTGSRLMVQMVEPSREGGPPL